jgi:hypothetical protein
VKSEIETINAAPPVTAAKKPKSGLEINFIIKLIDSRTA